LEITPISLHAGGVQHTIRKLSMKLKLCFKPHFNQKPTHKIMSPQSRESLKTKWHLGVGPMAKHRVYYKGEGGGFPKSGLWWILWVPVCPWLVHAKCYNYALTNLLFGLCMSMWISEVLVNLPSPISELQHVPLYPRNVTSQRVCPNSFSLFSPSLSLSSPLDSMLSPSRSLGVRQSP